MGQDKAIGNHNKLNVSNRILVGTPATARDKRAEYGVELAPTAGIAELDSADLLRSAFDYSIAIGEGSRGQVSRQQPGKVASGGKTLIEGGNIVMDDELGSKKTSITQGTLTLTDNLGGNTTISSRGLKVGNTQLISNAGGNTIDGNTIDGNTEIRGSLNVINMVASGSLNVGNMEIRGRLNVGNTEIRGRLNVGNTEIMSGGINVGNTRIMRSGITVGNITGLNTLNVGNTRIMSGGITVVGTSSRHDNTRITGGRINTNSVFIENNNEERSLLPYRQRIELNPESINIAKIPQILSRDALPSSTNISAGNITTQTLILTDATGEEKVTLNINHLNKILNFLDKLENDTI